MLLSKIILQMSEIDIKQLLDGDEQFYPQTDIHALVNDGQYAIDEEPTPDSSNLVTSGGITNVYGQYKENSEYIQILTDTNNKIIEGFKSDGTKFIGGNLEVNGDIINKGQTLQSQIDNAIEDMQEQVEDVLETAEETLSYFDSIENPEWIQVTTDSVGKILEGIKKDGSKYLPQFEEIYKDLSSLNSNKADKTEVETHFYRIAMFNKMLCCGDSMTQGMVTEGTQEHPSTIQSVVYEASWPTKFGKLFPYLNITNEGWSGITATGWYQQRYAQVDFSQYDLVFFMLGGNGWLHYEDLDVEGTNTNDYRKIITGAREQNPDATFVIMRYPGLGGDFIPILEFLAQESDCILLDLWNTDYINLSQSIYHGWYNDEGTAKYDSVHMTRKGYNAMAYVIARLFANELSEETEYKF